MFFDLPPVQPSTEIVITSDYVRDGLSLTDGKGAVQGAVRLDAGAVYVRAAGTLAKFDNAYGADAEVRLTAGVEREVAGFNVNASATYTNYRGTIAGVDNDEMDYRVDVSRDFGKVNAAVAFQYNPDTFLGGGSEKLVDTRVSVPVGYGAELSGGAGRVWADQGDYTIWNVGVTKNITETVALDVRYYDNTADNRVGVSYGDRIALSLRTSF